jgi:hypothetical protein
MMPRKRQGIARKFGRWRRGGKFARTRDQGVHYGRDRPIATLPVIVVEAVLMGPVDRACNSGCSGVDEDLGSPDG